MLDRRGSGGAVLMDLSNAFDTLNHDLLIAKRQSYGFDYNALKLIKSYLSNRWQRTKINTSFSSWSELITGVPQGLGLGLYYLIYSSTICFTYSTIRMSAIMQMTLYFMLVMKIWQHS